MATNGLSWTDAQTAQAYRVSTRTLERLRQQACEEGVEAALLGQPRQHWLASKYTGEVEAHLAVAACSAPPAGHAQWTLQLLTAHLVTLQVLPEASPAMVGRGLKKCVTALEAAEVGNSAGPERGFRLRSGARTRRLAAALRRGPTRHMPR